MGVTPPVDSIIYTGQEIIEGSFTLLPKGEKNIKIYASQELSEYLFFENNQTELRMHVTGPTRVTYYLRPPKGLSPGDYRIRITNEQYFTPEEEVEFGGIAKAVAAMSFLVKLRVPNEGKFLEGRMVSRPSTIDLGDPVYLDINLINLGTEEIKDIKAAITISDPDQMHVDEIYTKSITSLAPAQQNTLHTYWSTKDAQAGTYTASTIIEYGGDYPLELSHVFRVGDIVIKILNVSYDLNSSIGKIYVDIESSWNEVIPDVFAEIVVKEGEKVVDKVKTSSIDLSPWQQERLVGYWDRSNLASGEYDIDIFVYYYDKLAQEYVKVSLTDLEKAAPESGDSPLLIIAVVLLAFILIVNLLILVRNLRKK